MSVEQIPLKMACGDEVKRAHAAIRLDEEVKVAFRNARRIQGSFTSGLERRTLVWLALSTEFVWSVELLLELAETKPLSNCC